MRVEVAIWRIIASMYVMYAGPPVDDATAQEAAAAAAAAVAAEAARRAKEQQIHDSLVQLTAKPQQQQAQQAGLPQQQQSQPQPQLDAVQHASQDQQQQQQAEPAATRVADAQQQVSDVERHRQDPALSKDTGADDKSAAQRLTERLATGVEGEAQQQLGLADEVADEQAISTGEQAVSNGEQQAVSTGEPHRQDVALSQTAAADAKSAAQLLAERLATGVQGGHDEVGAADGAKMLRQQLQHAWQQQSSKQQQVE